MIAGGGRRGKRKRRSVATFPTFHILLLIGVAALGGSLGEREKEKENDIQRERGRDKSDQLN